MNEKKKRCLNTIMSAYNFIIVECFCICLLVIILIMFKYEERYWKSIVNDKEKKVELIKHKLEINNNLEKQLQNSISNLNQTEISFKQSITTKNIYLENENALTKYFKLKLKQPNKAHTKYLSPQQEIQIEKRTLHLISNQCYNNYIIDLDPTLFHILCDRYQATLTIIKTKTGNVFGGYTSQSWGGSTEKRDPNAFLFSIGILNNDIQFYPIKQEHIAINCKSILLPTFGIDDIFLNPHSGCSISRDIKCYDGFKSECELNKGKCIFDIDTIEVYSMNSID